MHLPLLGDDERAIITRELSRLGIILDGHWVVGYYSICDEGDTARISHIRTSIQAGVPAGSEYGSVLNDSRVFYIVYSDNPTNQSRFVVEIYDPYEPFARDELVSMYPIEGPIPAVNLVERL